jgi:exodeoxyribonuclease V alpha subunit
LVFGGRSWCGRTITPLGLFHQGDIGICLHLKHACGFEGEDGRPFAPARSSHDSAFAMTVHKSQGSFAEVLLVLPEQPSPLLSRSLFYTGIIAPSTAGNQPCPARLRA